jgi:hypothetical protein
MLRGNIHSLVCCMYDYRYDPFIEDLMKKLATPRAPPPSYRKPPEPYPMTLYFNLHGYSATHTDVLSRIRKLLPLCADAEVSSIQFQPIELSADTRNMTVDNRWIVTLNRSEAIERLYGLEMEFGGGKKVVLRRYDDILQAEYRRYLRRCDLLQIVTDANKPPEPVVADT